MPGKRGDLLRQPNLSRDRSRAFSASMSRSRAGAWVCSDASNFRAACETSSTARLNASSLACEGLLKPDSFRTNCSAEAWTSSSVAGGSKLNSVLMLRHMMVLTGIDIAAAARHATITPTGRRASYMSHVTYKIVQHDD